MVTQVVTSQGFNPRFVSQILQTTILCTLTSVTLTQTRVIREVRASTLAHIRLACRLSVERLSWLVTDVGRGPSPLWAALAWKQASEQHFSTVCASVPSPGSCFSSSLTFLSDGRGMKYKSSKAFPPQVGLVMVS